MVKIKRGFPGELNVLHRRMERMLENVLHRHGATAQQAGWCPATDLYETDGEIVVMLEVAGIEPDLLEITLEDTLLRVAGRRSDIAPRRACVALHQMEIEYGTFERLLTLPGQLDGDAAEARLENGFLEIRIPKKPPAKGRVEITSS
jgi:HSP20 family molecular chaperone IbpA